MSTESVQVRRVLERAGATACASDSEVEYLLDIDALRQPVSACRRPPVPRTPTPTPYRQSRPPLSTGPTGCHMTTHCQWRMARRSPTSRRCGWNYWAQIASSVVAVPCSQGGLGAGARVPAARLGAPGALQRHGGGLGSAGLTEKSDGPRALLTGHPDRSRKKLLVKCSDSGFTAPDFAPRKRPRETLRSGRSRRARTVTGTETQEDRMRSCW